MTNKRRRLRRAALQAIPLVLAVGVLSGLIPDLLRIFSGAGLIAFWTIVYLRHRRAAVAQTRREWELLRAMSWEAYSRHYNERVPTIEQELDLWGDYHRHRHEMRYELVASLVRRYADKHVRIVDIGCGSMNVADLLHDLDAEYVGFDYPEPLILYGATKYSGFDGSLRTRFVRGDAVDLPFADQSVDIVVMSEVIEHLVRPELAVWELSRVLRPDGVLVLTTNNASEAPLHSPLSHPFLWLEKAIGATFPRVISGRPWVWPEPVDASLLPEGSPKMYVPHTHHIPAETVRMLGRAGLRTLRWSTFEFPPPQSAMAARLEKMGARGRRTADMIESIARHTPIVRRLGTHLLLVARKTSVRVADRPPAGVWPGPLSVGGGRRSSRA